MVVDGAARVPTTSEKIGNFSTSLTVYTRSGTVLFFSLLPHSTRRLQDLKEGVWAEWFWIFNFMYLPSLYTPGWPLLGGLPSLKNLWNPIQWMARNSQGLSRRATTTSEMESTDKDEKKLGFFSIRGSILSALEPSQVRSLKLRPKVHSTPSGGSSHNPL